LTHWVVPGSTNTAFSISRRSGNRASSEPRPQRTARRHVAARGFQPGAAQRTTDHSWGAAASSTSSRTGHFSRQRGIKGSGDQCPRVPQDFRGFSSPHWGVRAKELCHLRRVACAIKASCLITRKGFHHPTIGHQVGHKAWQRLRRQLGFICVRINPIQDHLHIPQLGIKHMHGAVHISLREGDLDSRFVCFIPQLGIKGVAQGLLCVWLLLSDLPEGTYVERRRTPSAQPSWWNVVLPAPVSWHSRTTTLLLPTTTWAGVGGSRWLGNPGLGGRLHGLIHHQCQLLLHNPAAQLNI